METITDKKSKWRVFFGLLKWALTLALLAFSFLRLEEAYFPCQKPVKYAIGQIDSRFGISREEVMLLSQKAETIWENPLGREFFQYDPNATLKINFIFDDRQQRAIDAKKMVEKIGDIGTQHEAIIQKYGSMSADYKNKVDQYNIAAKDYDQRLKKYNSEVDAWNAKGGAPKDAFDELRREKKDLDRIFAGLEKQRKVINDLVSAANGLQSKDANVVNQYNAQLDSYQNRFGESREFEQGNFNGKEINIYQFNQSDDLELVLAHELGHALGMGHDQDPKSVMYYLMGEQDLKNITATQEDLAMLKGICKI
jgi:hypothetical protein